MASPAKTIAFFGATGGCTNAALVLALQAGYTCTALARTPPKLRDMLVANGVAASALAAHLTIIPGDARDVAAQRATLAPVPGHDYAQATRSDDGAAYPYDAARSVAIVVSGIGMDALSRNPDMTICQDWARTFLDACATLDHRPFVAAISTTGITDGPRDVPLPFVPLYHVALKTPHVDKRVMEQVLVDAHAARAVRGTVCVRPSLLLSGAEHDPSKIRTGSEAQPALGYTINRLDVGRWIFEEIIQGDEERWSGEKPTVTV